MDDALRGYLLSQLDALEKYFRETETPWDDIIAIPAIEYLRSRIRKDADV
jgi:hypothetical protein